MKAIPKAAAAAPPEERKVTCQECLKQVGVLAYPLVHADGLDRVSWHTRSAGGAFAVTCPGSWGVAGPAAVVVVVTP